MIVCLLEYEALGQYNRLELNILTVDQKAVLTVIAIILQDVGWLRNYPDWLYEVGAVAEHLPFTSIRGISGARHAWKVDIIALDGSCELLSTLSLV